MSKQTSAAHTRKPSRARAVVAVQTALILVVLCGMLALTIDVGVLFAARADLQAAADAAALAGAMSLYDESGLNGPAAIAAAQKYGLANNAVEQPVNIPAEDIQLGFLADPNNATSVIIPTLDSTTNTVTVTASRGSSGNPSVELFFASIFGFKEANVSATASASRFSVDTVNVVPISLRDPAFGPVDPDVSAANPGKDGPSFPANGSQFQLGEEVVVFIFGKGVMPPVHLALDSPEYSGTAETNKLLGGEYYPASVSINDHIPIWNNGTGNQEFGEKLGDRLENMDPDDDTIVMPIVQALPGTRGEDGRISGDVLISDFVGVRLLRIDPVEVANPKDPTKTISIEQLVGVVVPVVVSGGAGSSGSGVGGDTIETVLLVR